MSEYPQGREDTLPMECNRGWEEIIINLDKAIYAIDPDYVIDQIKEKFGGLRYYVHGKWDEATTSKIYALIDNAASQADKTCEFCGNTENAKLRNTGWMKVLCEPCLVEYCNKRGITPYPALDEELA